MKTSILRLAQVIILCISTILMLVVPATGQTDCSLRGGGAGFTYGSNDQRAQEYCTKSPTDITYSDLTCIGCLPDDAGRIAKGGTDDCTNYTQQMVILFPEPVADLEWEVWGARTVTDNRGYTVHLNPLTWPSGAPRASSVARFPGGGITSLAISDPIVYDVFPLRGFWEINSWNYSYTPNSIHLKCNCERPTIQRPPTQNVSSTWPISLDGTDPNWSMLAQITDQDGLVLRDIRLGGRYMAEKISVP